MLLFLRASDTLDFEEFVFVLGKFTAGEAVSDLLGRFVDHVASSLVVRLARSAKPIFKDMEEELDFQRGGREHWRLSAARIVDGTLMHLLLLALLFVDFVAVIAEIFLSATQCKPTAGQAQVDTSNVLHSISMHILYIFAAHLALLLCVYQLRFAHNIMHVVDVVIVLSLIHI